MNKFITVIFILTSMNCMGQKDFDKKIKSLVSGSVPYIQDNELKEKMDNGEEVIILDTRSVEEFEVSHIQKAKFIDYDTFSPSMVSELDKNKPIVVYCSVGYRSEKIGEKLLDMGFKNVNNLYGGIFQWKNQGNTVVAPTEDATDSVHTYNRNWSKWLFNGVKVYDE